MTSLSRFRWVLIIKYFVIPDHWLWLALHGFFTAVQELAPMDDACMCGYPNTGADPR
jgi:hypothetical protein